VALHQRQHIDRDGTFRNVFTTVWSRES
jgi:hypothetical protein